MSTVAQANTVLVTGGAGFLGSHAAEALLQRGADVVVLDTLRSNWPYPSAWKAANMQLLRATAVRHSRKLQVVVGDVRNVEDVAAAFAAADVGAVLHLAALSGVVGGRPEETVGVNVGGTCVVLDAARRAGASRVVVASSGAVYGDRGEALMQTGYAETHPADTPLSVYGASKRSAELVCHALCSTSAPATTVCRLFTVRGYTDNCCFAHTLLLTSRGMYIGVWPAWQAGHGAVSVHPRRHLWHAAPRTRRRLVMAGLCVCR